MDKAVVVTIIVGCVLISIAESIAVARDAALTNVQRWFQLVLVWVLPIVGAAITFSFRELTSATPTVGDNQAEVISQQAIDLDIIAGTSHHYHNQCP